VDREDTSFFFSSNVNTNNVAADNTLIRVQDAAAIRTPQSPNNIDFSYLRKTTTVSLAQSTNQSPSIRGQGTLRPGGFKAVKAAKAKMTSYEICIQKSTLYMRAKKYDRCEALMKQGSAIFRREECKQQFAFN